MDSKKLPMTSLKDFEKEVLSKSGEKALPCNLADKWLELLGRDFDVLSGNEAPEYEMEFYAAAPIALTCRVLAAKRKTVTVTLDKDELQKYLDILNIEISSEIINRSNNGVYVKPATMKNIFDDNRNIQWTLTPELKADILAGRINIDDL